MFFIIFVFGPPNLNLFFNPQFFLIFLHKNNLKLILESLECLFFYRDELKRTFLKKKIED